MESHSILEFSSKCKKTENKYNILKKTENKNKGLGKKYRKVYGLWDGKKAYSIGNLGNQKETNNLDNS